MGFLMQWKVYFDQMPSLPSAEFSGKKLDATVFEKVRLVLCCSLVIWALTRALLLDVVRTVGPVIRTDARYEGPLEAYVA